ncbi:MAG: PP2C family protein-serine/threonine phosphatase [Oscillospiraceae bacterium]|nr:PP2C family protein-serine/threonine phosphatase [Oscillospiraceae bacterium]
MKKIDRKKVAVIVFLISAVLFFAFTMPFRLRLAAADITEMRPVSALTPVLGLIFGLPAAAGCAVGNIAADMLSGYELSYALLNGAQQLLYGMLAYVLWRRINKEHDGSEFCLDSVSRLLKMFLVMAVVAAVTVVCSAVTNHVYNVSDIITINSLYAFINTFDSGVMFGCPLMIGGHFLQKYLADLADGKKEKIITFSLNERMIVNTLITGLGICLLIGTAVYVTDKISTEDNTVGLWGRIYLFQTLALNFYFALSMGFMWFTEKKISRPVEHLADVAKEYYAEHSDDEGRKKLLDACSEYSKDNTEVGNLARSYISMAEDLESYVDNLQKVTAEKERINAELSLASSIQAHMLPCIFPAFPEHSEFDIYATMTPAKEVGGDFYDFFMVDDTHVAAVMADVSGKGVPAALFMVIAKTLIKNYAQSGIEPYQVFTTANRMLCDGNDAGLFVTAWMGVLDITSGKLTYVNAGHNPPMIRQKGGSFEYLRSRPGFVLAGMETVKYRQNELMLEPGDRLFLYTDGITEATSSAKELYGEQRLSEYLNGHADNSAEDILHGLKADVDSFVGEAPQFDDMTMLMLDYKKKQEV